MANINKIRVSGTTYDIQDSNAPKVIELTQAEFDALTVKDPNVFYVITDSEYNFDGYWTSAQTQNAIAQSVSGKADTATTYTKTEVDTALASKQSTLESGTNIKTINGESVLGSGNIEIEGGSTYTAGRGISLSNNTISVSLPISAGTGTNSIVEGHTSNKASGSYSHAEGRGTSANSYSHAEGYNTTASTYAHSEGYNTKANGNYSHAEGQATKSNGDYSHAEGQATTTNGYYSHTEGMYTVANNQSEHASGQYNNSVSASTTFGNSGNTLFSVGNGTANDARHNAFEIRQNGDIYIVSGNTDIKLQDHLGGGSVNVDSTLSPTSENPVQNKVIYNKINEVEQVTARALNELNDNFGGLKLVKLSQAEYDALATKDPSILYVIVD